MNTHLLRKAIQQVWEESVFYNIYCFANFVRTIGKIWIVEQFIEDESHPWLSPPMEIMNDWQYEKCTNYIDKVVPKKRHVSI